MPLIIFVLSTASIVWILLRSPLFKRVREAVTQARQWASSRYQAKASPLNRVLYLITWCFDTMMGCAGCMGFWCGGLLYTLKAIAPAHFDIIEYALTGCIASLVIMQIHQKLN
jgi:hypothetical protein